MTTDTSGSCRHGRGGGRPAGQEQRRKRGAVITEPGKYIVEQIVGAAPRRPTGGRTDPGIISRVIGDIRRISVAITSDRDTPSGAVAAQPGQLEERDASFGASANVKQRTVVP